MSAGAVLGPDLPGASAPGAGLVPERLPVLRASAAAGTRLAAFHRALRTMGLAHYNLVRLSSVIPPDTEVVAGRPHGAPALHALRPSERPVEFADGRWGDRVYCVYAEQSTDVPGEQAWAGVGWAQRTDGQGGYFVEHEGSDPDVVVADIRASLADMVADEDVAFGPAEWVLEGVTCEDRPVCALVIVPYAAVGWGP